MPVNPDTLLVRDRKLAATVVDGNVVVLSLQAGSYFDLNRVGSEIWSMLAEPRRVTGILDALAQKYGFDRDSMTRDVTVFLQDLVDARLISIVATGDTIG